MSQPTSHSQSFQRLVLKGRLRQLQMVVTIARTGSMHSAAHELSISQPAITKALAEFEADIGITLFERHARGMRLSRAGAHVLPDLQRILDATRRFTETVTAQREEGASMLRLASVAAGISGLLAARVPAFTRSHPEIVLSVDEIEGPRLLDHIARDEFDIYCCRMPQTTPEGWDFMALEEDEHAIIAAPDHPLAGARQVTYEDLQASHWLTPPSGVPAETMMDEIFGTDALPRMAHLPTRSRTINRAMIKELGLLSAAPISIYRADLENGTLVRIAYPLDKVMSPLGLLYPLTSRGAAMDRFLRSLGGERR